jgi:hypothetical protein
MSVSLIRANRRLSALFGTALVGSLITWQLFSWIQYFFLIGQTRPNPQLRGLYQLTALVIVPSTRFAVLQFTLTVGLPTLLGIGYALSVFYKNNKDIHSSKNSIYIVRLSILMLVSSWFAWYTLLSIGWIRDLFPATFFGSILVSAMLCDMGYYLKQPFVLKQGDEIRVVRYSVVGFDNDHLLAIKVA